MKITFTTPIDYTDGSAIAAAALAAANYTVFVDTVNPPVKSYSVPAANLAAGVKQADGSLLVTVDAVIDLKAPLVAGTSYFVAAEDTVSGQVSPETAILTVVYEPTPNSPGNFSAA